MSTTPDTKIQAARKAFHAYERAVAVAREVMEDGPVRGLGTTVFEAQYSEQRERGDPTGFKCVECGFVKRGVADADVWKFCPGCAAEIMRFARDPERELQEIEIVVVSAPQREPQEIEVVVGTSPKGASGRRGHRNSHRN
jgi:hypothetical protein